MKNKKKRQPKPNPVLEAAFQCGKFDYKSLCSDTGLSDRQISVWMRLRNHVGKRVLLCKLDILVPVFRPSPLDKFSESFWRWTFYFLAHVYSIWALADKPWVWNTLECWYGYPGLHNIGTLLKYYLLETLKLVPLRA